jgi:hypothetical protein
MLRDLHTRSRTARITAPGGMSGASGCRSRPSPPRSRLQQGRECQDPVADENYAGDAGHIGQVEAPVMRDMGKFFHLVLPPGDTARGRARRFMFAVLSEASPARMKDRYAN